MPPGETGCATIRLRLFAEPRNWSGGRAESRGQARDKMRVGGGNLYGRAGTIETKVCPRYFLPGEYDFLCTLGDMG